MQDLFGIKELVESGAKEALAGGLKGIEKESLRVTIDGTIAQTPHPKSWGASLTHPFITTDYSEALPELITPPSRDTEEAVSFLKKLHHFLYQHMDESEMLWCASMPCAVSDEKAIPIAEYGNSNVGKMKHIYRLGLDFRYGRRMQAIAGVHFNYSVPDKLWNLLKDSKGNRNGVHTKSFRNQGYFSLIRNYCRMSWIIPLLFGSSPVVCKSFLSGNTARFKKLLKGTYYLPYATSLRMSDIGYKNKNQSALEISYDGLDSYLHSLKKAISTPYPEYEAIGLYDGLNRIQLSTNILQIENEYYSSIRPKRNDSSGKRPSTGLRLNGVEYVEMRGLDVDMLNPYGINFDSLLFCEAFLIYCLLERSPLISEKELRSIEYNEITVALRGRQPNLLLNNEQAGKQQSVKAWTNEMFERMIPICELLDGENKRYSSALNRLRETVVDTDLLPSAKILDELTKRKQEFHSFALELSTDYKEDLKNRKLSVETENSLKQLGVNSFNDIRLLEQPQSETLEEYIKRYLEN